MNLQSGRKQPLFFPERKRAGCPAVNFQIHQRKIALGKRSELSSPAFLAGFGVLAPEGRS